LRVLVAESKQVQAGRAESLKPNFGVLRRRGTVGTQISVGSATNHHLRAPP